MNFLTTIKSAAAAAQAAVSQDLNALTSADKALLQKITGSKTGSVAALKKAGAHNVLSCMDAAFKAFQLEAASKQAQLEIVLHAREQGWDAWGFGEAFQASLIAAGMSEKGAKNRASEARKVMNFKGDLPEGTASLQLMAKAIGAIVAEQPTGGADAPKQRGARPEGNQPVEIAGGTPAADALRASKHPAEDRLALMRAQVEWFREYLKPSDAAALELLASMADLLEELGEELATAPEAKQA